LSGSDVARKANRSGEDRLRPLFDPLDVDGTEERLRAALLAEPTDEGRAEVLTQLARVALFRDRFEAAHALLAEADELAGETGAARARVLLEGGRVARQTEGDRAALPLLAAAYEEVLAAGQYFVAADAAHSCALAGEMVTWTERGLDVAERHESAVYWKGTLLENLGEWQFERGLYEESLWSFRASLAARERDSTSPALTQYSRFGAARALQALGRADEALPLIDEVLAWVEDSGRDWPWAGLFRDELTAARAEIASSVSAI
jgi:tetratricopeptide (TPR) repeat protein